MESSHELLYLMSTGNDPSTSCKYKKLNKMNFNTVFQIRVFFRIRIRIFFCPDPDPKHCVYSPPCVTEFLTTNQFCGAGPFRFSFGLLQSHSDNDPGLKIFSLLASTVLKNKFGSEFASPLASLHLKFVTGS